MARVRRRVEMSLYIIIIVRIFGEFGLGNGSLREGRDRWLSVSLGLLKRVGVSKSSH